MAKRLQPEIDAMDELGIPVGPDRDVAPTRTGAVRGEQFMPYDGGVTPDFTLESLLLGGGAASAGVGAAAMGAKGLLGGVASKAAGKTAGVVTNVVAKAGQKASGATKLWEVTVNTGKGTKKLTVRASDEVAAFTKIEKKGYTFPGQTDKVTPIGRNVAPTRRSLGGYGKAALTAVPGKGLVGKTLGGLGVVGGAAMLIGLIQELGERTGVITDPEKAQGQVDRVRAVQEGLNKELAVKQGYYDQRSADVVDVVGGRLDRGVANAQASDALNLDRIMQEEGDMLNYMSRGQRVSPMQLYELLMARSGGDPLEQ